MFFRTSLIFLLLLISCSFNGLCQQIGQKLFGSILQQESLQPIPEVYLILKGDDFQQQAISDSSGRFTFTDVPPGRYSLRASHLSYSKKVIPEIYIKASRPEKVTIHLQERELVLQEAEIQPLPVTRGTSLHSTTFTIEETQRFPASFFDPARLIISQPGVTTSNDQANQLVIHGQSPNNVGWQLEGAEILNPNHLPNAGTFSDRSSPSGGGVNILSGQLMGNSRFYSGALPATMGNAIGGLFDISLREGSRQQRSHTLQASLLGIDLATEGPFQKEKNSSYLVNYRYSTVGLLGQLGVNFGNEEIEFQDLAFHLNFPNTKAGDISFYGLGGLSNNNLNPLEDTAEWESDKDRQEVRFGAGMAATGLRQNLSLSGKASLTQSLAYSTRYSNRQGQFFNPTLNPFNVSEESIEQHLLSYKGIVNKQHSEVFSSSSGLAVNYYRSSLFSVRNKQQGTDADYSLSYTSLQPFTEIRYSLSSSWLLTGGLRFLYDSHNTKLYPEPRLEILHGLSPGSSIQLSYNLLSQPTLTQPFLIPAAYSNGEKIALEPIRSHYTALGYEKDWQSNTSLKTKVFYQFMNQVPVSLASGIFSALNTVEDLALGPIASLGRGQVYGFDASLQRYFIKDLYYLLSISTFNATYEDAKGDWHNMRFNSQYTMSFTGGKEWTKEKKDKLRTIGLNLRGLYRGGYWHTPINEAASRAQSTTVFDWDRPFEERLPAYFSFDLRLSHTKQKENYLRTWSLDIQNVTNRQNISWYYYDQLLDEVRPAYQLGIIPVLGYRIEF